MPASLRLFACLLAAISAPAIATERDAVQEEFRQALLRLAQSGDLPDADAPLVVDRPSERVVDFGLLVDRDHEQGLRVLGTLPGGSAERMDLRADDRLVEANGVDLTGAGGSERMRSLLETLGPRERMNLRVLRDGREQRLIGTVDAIVLPAMRVELFPDEAPPSTLALDGRVPGDPGSSCGRVSTFAVAPRARDLFPARLMQVDGELPGPSSQDTFRLPPGRHRLTVAELIDERQFSVVANQQRSRGGRDTYRTLEVDVQPGITYLLAARFHRDRRGSIGDAAYWEPVIWKERAERCD